jgi:hypothetical protein
MISPLQAVEAGEYNEIPLYDYLPADVEGKHVKALVWEDFKTFQPYTTPVIVR